MSLNADLIRARCAEIEESLGRLERFGGMSREAFCGIGVYERSRANSLWID